MRIQIRRGVFETNSSSTHSITICTKQQYEDWQNGKLKINQDYDRLMTEAEIQEYKANHPNRKYFDFKTFREFWDSCDMETFEEEYTTPGGEKIMAFGYYGYDG